MVTAEKTRPTQARSGTGKEVWITAKDAAGVIGRGLRALERLADAGHIRCHRPPGLPPKFHREDCEKLAPPA